MLSANTADGDDVQPLGTRFLVRVFAVFSALAIISLIVSVSGKFLGRSIQMAGHTSDTTVHEILIGNNVLAVPANAIRFERQRLDGVLPRVDLYLHWPDLTGYTVARRDSFNHVDGTRSLVFLSFLPRTMSRDMSGRLDPIYGSLVAEPGLPGPGGLMRYSFKPDSGYADEILMVGVRTGAPPYVARCLTGSAAEQIVAECEHDIHIGDDLSLLYRFPEELLGEWRAVDAAVRKIALRILQSNV